MSERVIRMIEMMKDDECYLCYQHFYQIFFHAHHRFRQSIVRIAPVFILVYPAFIPSVRYSETLHKKGGCL